MRTHASSSHSSSRSSPRSSRTPRPSSPSLVGGRHELGQNFLTDRRVIDGIVALVAATAGPIIELGAGGGALTRPLAQLGRPLTALELDPRRADALRGELRRELRGDREVAVGGEPGLDRTRHVTVVQADALAWQYPSSRHVVVGNVPFHLTTAIMRSLLARGHWTDAVLLTQWEVARRRCGVGGSSLLTAQWDPWFAFTLHERVPARAFRPMPSVDGGVFSVERRRAPLVDVADRAAFQAFVAEAYRGRGNGMAQILARTSRPLPVERGRRVLRSLGLPAHVLPSRLRGAHWAAIWSTVRETPRAVRRRGATGGRD